MCIINCCFLWVLDTASVLNPSCDDSHLTCSIRTRQQNRTFFDTAWVHRLKNIWGVWGISWHIPRLECIIYTNFKFKSLFEPIGFVVLYPIFGQTHITQILPSIYWKNGRKRQHHPNSSQNHRARIPGTLFHFFLASQNRFWGSLALQSSTCRFPRRPQRAAAVFGAMGEIVPWLRLKHLDTAFALNGNVCQTQLLEVSAWFQPNKGFYSSKMFKVY